MMKAVLEVTSGISSNSIDQDSSVEDPWTGSGTAALRWLVVAMQRMPVLAASMW